MSDVTEQLTDALADRYRRDVGSGHALSMGQGAWRAGTSLKRRNARPMGDFSHLSRAVALATR